MDNLYNTAPRRPDDDLREALARERQRAEQLERRCAALEEVARRAYAMAARTSGGRRRGE